MDEEPRFILFQFLLSEEVSQIDMKRCLIALLWVLVVFCPKSTVHALDEWGHLTGTIRIEGEVPAPEAEIVDKDQTTCLANDKQPLDDNLIVDKSGGLRDVFVMMLLKPDSPKPAVHSSYNETFSQPVELDNKDCRFVPHAVFVRTGQTFRLKNSDDVGHNTHVTTFNNEANVTIPTSDHVDVVLKETDKSPGNVVCDIHRWMDAVVLVREEPYVAITQDDGSFEIKHIPCGEWEFQFWHKKAGYLKDLKIANYKVGRRGEIKIKITDGQTLDLGQMTFPATSLK